MPANKILDQSLIKSNAKINIGLNIIDKRPNGYHNIETLMQEIDFHDTIEIKTFINSGKTQIISSGINIDCSTENNTCYKMIELLKKEYSLQNQFCLKINKKINIGAGLGGGSSNAGSILNYLDKLFDLKISNKNKNILAQKIGMDVPFFIDGNLQYVEGMGEKTSYIKDVFSKYYFVLVFPKISISTKWAYSKIKKELPVKKLHYNLMALGRPIKWDVFGNDFEDIVIPIYPEIRDIKRLFYKNNAIFSSLSGSGSTIFGVYDDLNLAKKASNLIKDLDYHSIVANPIYKK